MALNRVPSPESNKENPHQSYQTWLKKYKSYFLLLIAIYLWQYSLKILLLSLRRDHSLHIVWKNKLFCTRSQHSPPQGLLASTSPNDITVWLSCFPVGDTFHPYYWCWKHNGRTWQGSCSILKGRIRQQRPLIPNKTKSHGGFQPS